MVNLRRLSGSEPKYVAVFRDRPAMFPAPSVVRPGKPLAIVEGEFDALLLGQELADLAAVVTLGSASSRPEGSTYLAMLAAPTWYLAHDADDAGDKAASGWPSRAIRVRPPRGKDWTEAHLAAIDLRRWWIENEFTDVFDREERLAIQEEGSS
jgi:DNA primase